MKYQEALNIIKEKEKLGFMISFEKHIGSILESDHFPDKHAGEDLIQTEREAWELAEQFANATGDDIVNIYVIDKDFGPVEGYREMKLKRLMAKS